MERVIRALKHPVMVIAAVTLLAGWIRFADLSDPKELVFDETYYAVDACIYLGHPLSDCNTYKPKDNKLTAASEQSWVHPPLGKWLIAGGEALFGNRPFGWRFSSAVAGTLTVALLTLLAYRLFGSVLWAGVAGLLLATESLQVVQSRVALLDIFVAPFVAGAFLFLTFDRQWIERHDPPPPTPDDPDPGRVSMEVEGEPAPLSFGPGAMAASEPTGAVSPAEAEAPDEAPSATGSELSTSPAEPPFPVPTPLIRPWRLAAGLFLGAAAAVKWSAVPALLAAGALSLAWEIGRRRRAFRPRPVLEALEQESFGLVVSFAFAPVLVYLATYAVWFSQNHWSITQFLKHQGDIWHFHASLSPTKPGGGPTHPYQSRAWSWLILRRPVAYYYKGTSTTAREILGIGNPAVFWGSLIAIPYTAVAWWRKRDWHAGMIAVPFLAMYLPWLPVNRPLFLFYVTPMIPFMVLACTYLLRDLARVRLRTGARAFAPVAAVLVFISVGLFVFYQPILVGHTLSLDAWHTRIWFPGWL